MGKLRNLALAGLVTLGSLGLINKGDAQISQNKYRVTELSSWPRKGIKDARYSQDGFIFRTNNEGYIDFLTNVDNKENLEIKLSKISFNNNVMFGNIGKANLVIYNILGQKVKEINNEGYLTWDLTSNSGQRVAFSSYLYKLEDENKIETGLIIPFANSYGSRNLILKNKSKANIPSSGKGSLSKSSTIQVVDTIYCDGRLSTRNLERILMSEFLATKLMKSNGSVVYSVEKDNAYYCIQDTVDSVDKIPGNIQMLEDIDVGKQDGIRSKEYIEMLRPIVVVNFGDFETNYPVPVFLDSAAIYTNQKIGTRAPMFLAGIRKIIQEAKDSLGLDLLKEVDNPNEPRIKLDYSSFSHVIQYQRLLNDGSIIIDSLRVYIDPQLVNSLETLMIEGRHELIGHLHAPFHSPYREDITNTSIYQGKTYSFGDKKSLRALALAKPGTYWKKFVKK